MTANQSSQLVKNPQTKKAIAVLERYAKAEAALKSLEAEVKDATNLIKEAMIAGGVDKITLDSETLQGYITLAERTNYKLEEGVSIEEIPEQFSKRALDTDKVKAQAVLTGQLPAGIVESKTQYITKKVKLVEK
jgi:hypothetical protein